jgi:type IV fimbrial biogenesis protein FimT
MPAHRGFTLWELLVTLAIAGVAIALAAPPFTEFLLDGRRTADVNALVIAVQLARSEAAKRGRPVVVCKTADRQRCGGPEIDFTAGWMVFANSDEQSPPHRSAGEPLLYAHTPATDGTIASNRPFYEFRVGRRSTNGTVVFCDRRGVRGARAVVISYTGRPRVAERDGDGRPLVCAEVT